MTKYEAVFLIQPPAPFGLPQEGVVVIPAGRDVYGPTLDSITGTKVAHGTVSIYREARIDACHTTGATALRVADNFLWVTFESEDDRSALEYSKAVADRFCLYLSAIQGFHYHPEMQQLVDEGTRRKVSDRWSVTALHLQTYSIERMRRDIVKALSIDFDESLEKAAAYFSYALYVQGNPLLSPQPVRFYSYLVTSQVILNCYKAVSVVVGEPGVDSDAQSRYRRLRVSPELWNDCETLRRLRNEFDVAHYSKGWDRLGKVQENTQFAKATAQAVVVAYMNHLLESDRPGVVNSLE